MKKNKRLIPQPRKIEIDYSEKWGKDVEEAVRLALIDLKLSRDEVKVTVLEEPIRGFLGIGAKLAKVRVEKISIPEQQSKDKEADPDSSKTSLPDSIETTHSGVTDSEESSAEKPGSKSKVRDLRKKKKIEDSGIAGISAGADTRSDHGRGISSGRGSRGDSRRERNGGDRHDKHTESRYGRHSEKKHSSHSDEHQKAADYHKGKKAVSNARDYRMADRIRDSLFDKNIKDGKLNTSSRPLNLSPIETENEADRFFREIIEKMRLDIKITSYTNEECVYLEVEGKDSRTVIGKRGQTLDAIQYLTNLVMNKNRDDYTRVIIDVEGYRSRREQTLENLALKLSGRVEKTGRSVRLEPMNPYERKVIHSTLQSNPGINTRSEGEEPYRRVIIEKK